MDEPLVILFACIMAVMWTIFPFIVLSRLKAIRDEAVKQTAESLKQTRTLYEISARVLRLPNEKERE